MLLKDYMEDTMSDNAEKSYLKNKLTLEQIENDCFYGCDDLGAVFTQKNNIAFKTWAPLADEVELLLFKDSIQLENPDQQYSMNKEASGVWALYNVDCSLFNYYKFRITNDGRSHDVCDIWSKSASADSVASQIVNISDGKTAVPENSSEVYDGKKESLVNPWSQNGKVKKTYSQAVIYEIHVRDWSRAFVKDSLGKFNDISDALTKGDAPFAKYLKSLGITHVQILPCFDYVSKNDDKSYNWGYDPYDYNVPEGRYVENHKDGTDAVIQFRKMVEAFHRNGICVNMDVVYNHTYATGIGSLYDMTVPQYFYRIKDGKYSDGSGCGNELATNHKMVEKYVLDSLCHWVLDYHVNGFRFDLMGCQEVDFIRKVYKKLSELDENIMVYGEPWTGGASAVQDGVWKGSIDRCAENSVENGVACFNDDFRNAIKGGEFGGFAKGHIHGDFKDADIIRGLLGSPRSAGGFTENPGRSINYCECHDNYTLFDKTAITYLGQSWFKGDLFASVGDKGLDVIKKQDKLAAAFVFLAQGTPFINGGQEFLRTKGGCDNSYKSEDKINEIDFSMTERFCDVKGTYQALIHLRHDFDAFTNAIRVQAITISQGITKYYVRGTNGAFLIYFNATDFDYKFDAVYGKKVNIAEDKGQYFVEENESEISLVEGKNICIIKTE